MSGIAQLLSATRANDKSVRVEAEAHIEQYVKESGLEFFTGLISLSGNPATDIADSQSALLVLKNCVVKYWSPGFEQFTGPPLSHEVREHVRSGLLQLLQVVQSPKIRSACALVISNIGSLEYPDQWPDLVELNIQLLHSDANTSILGGLVLFKELLLDTLREEDFMRLGEHILLRLLEIAKSPIRDGRQLLAVQCFHECITFLLIGDDDQLPHLDEVASRFIPQWCELFAEILLQPLDSELTTEIVNSVREVDSAFPQILEPQLPQLFNVTINALETQGSNLDDELKANLAYMLDTALQNTNARKRCLRTGGEIDQFTSLLFKLSILSDELAEWWVDDYNEFVTAELELNTGELNPRINAASLIAMTGQPAVLPRLLDLLSAADSEGSAAAVEAGLFLISNLLSQVDIDKHLTVVDFGKFRQFLSILELQNGAALSADAENAHVQLLVARKVSTAGTVAKYGGTYLQDDIKIGLATHGLNAPLTESPVVRAAQLRALSDGISRYPEAFAKHQSTGFKIIASLVESADNDTPAFLADTFGLVLKLDYEIVSRDTEAIDLLFALAGKDTSDIDLNAQILDVVGELLDAVSSRAVVDHILRPVISTLEAAAANGFEYTGDLYFSLDLATAIFEHEGVDFSSEEREQMLQSFYQVIITTEDHQILQVASFAYAALVQNIKTGISAEAANNVIRVAAQLLSPSLDDSAALASGKLVNAIIDQFGDALGDVLGELINASAKRLATAENALLIETLVLVFCELTLRNAKAVIDILVSLGMLEAVMKQWMPTFEVVRGADEIVKNIKAFQLLFELDDPRLASLMLPDEPIRNSNEILTRRKAKMLRFTQVPLPLKILKLLVRELAQAPNPALAEAGGGARNVVSLGGSDDEWDDELAINDDGDVFDYRTFNLILDWFKKLGQQPSAMNWLNQLNHSEQQILLELSQN